MKTFSAFHFPGPILGLAIALAAHAEQPPSPVAAEPVESIVAGVLAKNPELAFYEAEIEAARAGHRLASTREGPEIALGIGRKRVTDAAGALAGEGTAWSVSVSQTFEWPGRVALRKAIADRDVALAELGLERFKAALAGRARTLAFGLHAARERAAATAEVAARYRALRELFLARDPGGITPLLETRVIEAQELAIQHRATEAALAVHAAEVELNQLRGLPYDAPVAVAPVGLSLAQAPGIEEALAGARENNFEFRAAKIGLEQQGLTVSLARGDGRPGFTVSPFIEGEGADGREQTVGIGLSLPIPTRGRSGATTAVAESRRIQAEAAVLVAQRRMEREVINAVQTLGAKIAEMAQWAPDAPERFRDAAALADRHYRLGAVPIGTYVGLQDAYLDAIEALLETRRQALDAAGELQLLTGSTTPLVTTQAP